MLATPDKKPAPTIIVVHETLTQSVISDIVTFVMVVSIIGIGWLMNSSAMQWAGFTMFAVMTIASVTNKTKNRMTIAEARKKLDELEKLK
jgi:predicted cation transporter